MFNLIVRNVDWSISPANIPYERVLEHTDGDIIAQFKDKEDISLDKLISFPCLFLQEGISEEVAYIGQIHRIKRTGSDVSFEYSLDSNAPKLRNRMIYEKHKMLGITDTFEFSRNHWSVKDVNLYRFLLHNFMVSRQRPKVFTIEEHETINPLLVSVMMPFSQGFNAAYESIKSASTRLGLTCKRADDIWESHFIIQDVVSLIDRSRIVVCDCTGRNPNVFYEAGIAHTLGREVILITQQENDIPFDLRHIRFIKYLPNAEGLSALAGDLQSRIQTIIGH